MKLATRVIIGAALVTVANAVDGCAGLAVPCGATCCSAGSFCEKVGTHTRCQTVSKTDHKLPSISLPTSRLKSRPFIIRQRRLTQSRNLPTGVPVFLTCQLIFRFLPSAPIQPAGRTSQP